MLKLIGAELNTAATVHVNASFMMEAEMLRHIADDVRYRNLYIDRYCAANGANETKKSKLKAGSTLTLKVASYIIWSRRSGKGPLPEDAVEADQERRPTDVVSQVLGTWNLSQYPELSRLIALEAAHPYALEVFKKYLLHAVDSVRTVIKNGTDKDPQFERFPEYAAARPSVFVYEMFRGIFDVAQIIRDGHSDMLKNRFSSPELLKVLLDENEAKEVCSKWEYTRNFLEDFCTPFMNAMNIWIFGAEHPTDETWRRATATPELRQLLRDVTLNFEEVKYRPPQFLRKGRDADVRSLLGAFLATYNADPNKMPMFDAEALAAAEREEQAASKARKKRSRAKERMPDSDVEEDYGGAGPGPEPDVVDMAAAGTQSRPKRLVSLPDQERRVEKVVPAGKVQPPSRAAIERARKQIEEAPEEEEELYEYVSADLAALMRRPVTEQEKEEIQKDRTLLNAVNVCRITVNSSVKNYPLESKDNLKMEQHLKYNRGFAANTLQEDLTTARPYVDNTGLFIIPKGKTTDVLRDMFCGTHENGLPLRRAKLIFANPPWGVWAGSDDQPLSEGDIKDFADCFGDILDSRGVVLLEPGPNPTHHAAWVMAMSNAGFVQCRSPWLAQSTSKRPRMVYHSSPPHEFTPIYAFYRMPSELTKNSPGMSWNKGIASMVFETDFHRTGIVGYMRLGGEKVKGVPGSRAQSNCMMLMAQLIMMYVMYEYVF